MNTGTPITNSYKIVMRDGASFANGKWDYNVRLQGKMTLSKDVVIDKEVIVESNALINLNGYSLNVDSMLFYDGTININGGKLIVNKDLRLQGRSTSSDGTVTYSQAYYPYLKMNNPLDYVRVGGDFVTQSWVYSSSYLTNGTLEVRGDFIQKNGSNNNFIASGNHMVVLSGSRKQNVIFESTSSAFNKLKITKPINLGYVFSRNPLWKELIEQEPDTVAPSAPKNLHFTDATPTAVILSWEESTDNNLVDTYEIYRDGKLVGNSMVTSFVDTKLKSNTEYTYYVIAYDIEKNASPISNILMAATDTDNGAPTQPTQIGCTVNSQGFITISWLTSQDDVKVEGYCVYRDGIQIAVSNGTTFIDKTAAPGTHQYYVVAFDDVKNESKKSDAVTISNKAPDSPVLALNKVTDKYVVLNWTGNDGTDGLTYQVYRNNVLVNY